MAQGLAASAFKAVVQLTHLITLLSPREGLYHIFPKTWQETIRRYVLFTLRSRTVSSWSPLIILSSSTDGRALTGARKI